MIEYIIDDAQPIIAEIGPPDAIEAEIGSGGMTAEIAVGGVIHIQPEDLDYYEGDTTVTPKAEEETILQTEHKIVEENITVLRVPYYETTNPTGGNTVYIAGETEAN